MDEINEFDLELLKKTIKKSIDEHIKNLHKLSDDELKQKHVDTKKERNPKTVVAPHLKKLWAPEKQHFIYSEFDRLIEVIDNEIKKRKKK